LITLVGPGGVGKTRLASELGRRLAAADTRVLFVELAAIRDPAFVAPAIAGALGLSDVTAIDLPRRAGQVCGQRPTLLLLDNCEHVLAAAPLVADLLAAAASIRLLATSRAPLGLRGERLYALGPLELPPGSDMLSPADLIRASAVRLFVDRVRDVQPDFRLTSANGPAVTAICRRLDALPLALELAATRMKVLTVDELLGGLERDVLLPDAGPRDLPERQQSMVAAVAWSYQLLDPEQQRAFRRLGVVPGRFPIEAAASVLAGREGTSGGLDVALTATGALIERSLVQRTEPMTGGRSGYRMLECVRGYALLELSASGERDDACDGLARYCGEEASRAAVGLGGAAQVAWLNRVREDLASYRATLTWLIERGRCMEASTILWQLNLFWLIGGHAAEGLRWSQEILSGPSLPPAAESRALATAGMLSYTQGALGQARTTLTRALDLARPSGDANLEAQAEHLLGHVELGFGNVEVARQRFARSVEQFKALSIAWGGGTALSGMAWAALATGDTVEAERLLDEATSILHDAGPWFLSLVTYLRAILAVRRGNGDEAIVLVRDNLTRIRELRDKFAFVYSMVPLAAASVLKGDGAWTARILGARDAVTERTGATVVDNSVRDLQEHAERWARARLGPHRWAHAYAAGRAASIDAMLMDIDRVRA
jgi:predicted ATPase